MSNRIIFIVFNNQILFSNDQNMDHHEWYQKLGGNMDNYENTIRGFITNSQIIFYKANLSYDQEVIDIARRYSPMIREQMKNPYLKVCCGINPGSNGASWEPILVLNDNELTGFANEIEKKQQAEKEALRQERIMTPNETVIDFKNNYEDPKFIKFASIFTFVMIALAVLSKVLMILRKEELSGWLFLLAASQIVLLVVTLIGYRRKMPQAKYFGIASSLALVFMFNIFDVIIGVVNLFFTVDQGYILGAIKTGKKGISKIQGK